MSFDRIPSNGAHSRQHGAPRRLDAGTLTGDGMSDALRRQINPHSVLLSRQPDGAGKKERAAREDSFGKLDTDAKAERLLQEAAANGGNGLDGFAEELTNQAIQTQVGLDVERRDLQETVDRMQELGAVSTARRTANASLTGANIVVQLTAADVLTGATIRLLEHNAKLLNRMERIANARDKTFRQLERVVILNNTLIAEMEKTAGVKKTRLGRFLAKFQKKKQVDIFTANRLSHMVGNRIADQRPLLPREPAAATGRGSTGGGGGGGRRITTTLDLPEIPAHLLLPSAPDHAINAVQEEEKQAEAIALTIV